MIGSEQTRFGPVNIDAKPAAIALRIPYLIGDNSRGIVPVIGLKLHGGAPIVADDWKWTLAGDVLPPTMPGR